MMMSKTPNSVRKNNDDHNVRPRYTQIPFPAYRFIPGENPHPIDDPQGHSYKKYIEIPGPLKNQNWQTNERYLFGVDLYNYAFCWEAHEAFESLWQITPAQHPLRDFLQGLIKICAAFLKWHSRKIRGVKILYTQGYEHLRSVMVLYPVYMGLNLEEYLENLKAHFAWLNDKPVSWKDPLEHYPFINLNDKTEC